MTLPALPRVPAADHPELLAPPVHEGLEQAAAAGVDISRIHTFPIDAGLADTAALCEATGIPMEASANCVLVAGKRGGEERIAACVVLAHTRADVNTTVKKLLDVRKASFLPMDRATEESGMEYGGITPVGLPSEWRLLVDSRVADAGEVVIGSGIRASKIVLEGALLARLPGAELIEGLATIPEG
ncbi:YbaK/EbsC family protein [Sediminivirga luteola]|uniref:YbaK/aminoacyl-tRNA synthetase-associated domain-containing protein n=1 Tax=Sediminivirga luteola TaxID=1774748 RepID=A0A8J2TWL8_9MICO|nr:YbaK/EbsC family protein [Sediminivirga luteola]MCI2263945.1 YbaK/EbsC family protein [Sediminivirga luteola]GGA08866.1 hypothetical protein GCM10011333_09810 [Sediminivirga luteola]